jgi:hypothetical protein
MMDNIQSRKNGEVAELRWKLNLQLFAEEAEPAEPTEPAYVEPEEPEDVTWEPFESDKPKVEPEKTEEPEVVDPEPEKPKQDHETNKAFQEMRKAREEAERRAKAADEIIEREFGHLGIKTVEQYHQYLQDEKKRREYAEKGIDYDEVRKIAKEEADNHPDVIKARQEAQRMAVNSEIRELKTAYPELDISEVDRLDPTELRTMLSKLPNWDQMEHRVNRGYSLKDAYELANREAIEQKRLEAAKQAERNKIHGKAHLKPSGSAETGDAIIVPPEVMNQYRQIFKKQLKAGTMTESDFVNHYKKSLRGG